MHDKKLVLTVVNPHATQPRETELSLRGATVRSIRATTLSSNDLRAHNNFENPRALELVTADVNLKSPGSPVYSFPPASVTRLEIQLA